MLCFAAWFYGVFVAAVWTPNFLLSALIFRDWSDVPLRIGLTLVVAFSFALMIRRERGRRRNEI